MKLRQILCLGKCQLWKQLSYPNNFWRSLGEPATAWDKTETGYQSVTLTGTVLSPRDTEHLWWRPAAPAFGAGLKAAPPPGTAPAAHQPPERWTEERRALERQEWVAATSSQRQMDTTPAAGVGTEEIGVSRRKWYHF